MSVLSIWLRSILMIRYLTQEAAKRLDEQLMGPIGFSVDQLMELAGLSVACAVQKEFEPGAVVVVCGPGNNGGDGLVAARHLSLFGFRPEVLYPKPTSVPLYLRLLEQCRAMAIPVHQSLPSLAGYDLIVDAVFGFSFTGNIRAPFDTVISDMKAAQKPIVSVDIPSGWDVEAGNTSGLGLEPQVLVSLTLPKECARHFSGTHYIGGRFLPPSVAAAFDLEVPVYPGCDQVLKVCL
jgi:NAD(P)H-hydrate epimerase